MDNGHFSLSRATSSRISSHPLYGHWVSGHCLFSLSYYVQWTLFCVPIHLLSYIINSTLWTLGICALSIFIVLLWANFGHCTPFIPLNPVQIIDILIGPFFSFFRCWTLRLYFLGFLLQSLFLCGLDVFVESLLKTDTRIKRRQWHVALVFVLTGFCIYNLLTLFLYAVFSETWHTMACNLYFSSRVGDNCRTFQQQLGFLHLSYLFAVVF